MKIIKQGKLPEEQIYHSVCNYCKTEFEFAEKEGKVVFEQRDGDYVAIDCPLCKRRCTHTLIR